MFILFSALILVSTGSWASTNVAMVKILRGKVEVTQGNKTSALNLNDWVSEGSSVKTANNSFVKLIFLDKSQMNVGPESEMKIQAFSGKDSGVIDLVKGVVRSQVTKDYLQMKDKNKSKLFIKTAHAVLGVRGTDFLISSNGQNTSTILFEGEVAFNKIDAGTNRSASELEDMVNKGVRVFPGEFSVMDVSKSMPTVPSLLNVNQLENLENNVNFNQDRSPSSETPEVVQSIVPKGLSGALAANDGEVLKGEIVGIVSGNSSISSSVQDKSAPEGFVNGEVVKPANGSLIHLASGLVISPGPGAVLDPITNTYIAGAEVGTVRPDGSYVPPSNVEISSEGKVTLTTVSSSGEIKKVEVALAPPVVNAESSSFNTPGAISLVAPAAVQVTLSDFTNLRPAASGGIQGINDPQRATSTFTNVTFRTR